MQCYQIKITISKRRIFERRRLPSRCDADRRAVTTARGEGQNLRGHGGVGGERPLLRITRWRRFLWLVSGPSRPHLRRAHRGCRCLVPSACLSGAGPRYKASERLRYVLMAAPSASANTSAVPAPFPFIANYQLALASRRRSDHGIIRDVGVAGLNPVTQINKINEIAAFISWQPKVEGSRKRTASALGSISRLLPDRFLLRLPPHPHMCVDQRVYLLTL